MIAGIGWRGTGGRSLHSSRNNLLEEAFRFLPVDSLNQNEPPKLLIKKSPGLTPAERMRESTADDDAAGGDRRKKRSTGGLSAEERSQREEMVVELVKKLDSILGLLNKVQTQAEQLIRRQTESEDFQKQMKKETEGYDLQRGVYRILDALDGDRRELARLQKKTVEMRKRQLNGTELGEYKNLTKTN